MDFEEWQTFPSIERVDIRGKVSLWVKLLGLSVLRNVCIGLSPFPGGWLSDMRLVKDINH